MHSRTVVGIAASILLAATGCGNAGKDCCNCIIANGCWDSNCSSGNPDPQGSCYWWMADGPLPSYASSGWKVCAGYHVGCPDLHCKQQCAGVTAGGSPVH